MMKISTSGNNLKSDSFKKNENPIDDDEMNDAFYRTLQSKLNALVKNPSPETIRKILSHAKRP